MERPHHVPGDAAFDEVAGDDDRLGLMLTARGGDHGEPSIQVIGLAWVCVLWM